MRVLVIHDTRAMRMIVRRALHHLEGVDDVIQAESAEEALDTLQSEPVDLVLCDWNLNGMAGIELLEALRTANWDVPFGFVTAEKDERIRRRALDSGASFLLTKPFTDHELGDELVRIGALLPMDPDADLVEEAAEADGTHEAVIHEIGDTQDAEHRAAELEALLTKLTKTVVTVKPVHFGPDRHSPRYVGSYYDEENELSALCVFATSFGLAAAASLTNWSPRATREWVGTGIMPAELLGDLYEVANVLAQFVRRDGRRVVIRDLEGYAPGERFDASGRLESRSLPEHYAVEVEGYCGGLLTVMAL